MRAGLLLLFLALGQPPSDEPASAARKEDLHAAPKAQLPKVSDDFQPNEPSSVQLAYDPAFLALFEEHSIRYTGGGYRDKLFRYRLFVPAAAGPDDKRPLVVWLHGMSTSGDDNISQLRHVSTLIMPQPWEHDRYPFFLLAVQCPHENRAWTTTAADADDMLNVLSEVLDRTIDENPIDPDRVSLTGVSSGGSGAWEFALRRPEVWSCVAPIASGGAHRARLHDLVKVPVWAFHASEDKGSPVEAVRSTVAALQADGGMAHLTEVNMRGHNCWNEAFLDYDLLDWMLAQKRGQPPAEPIGSLSLSSHARVAWRSFTRHWTWTQALAQVGVPVVVLIAFLSAKRNRRKRRVVAESRAAPA
jgi:predicted peptidase